VPPACHPYKEVEATQDPIYRTPAHVRIKRPFGVTSSGGWVTLKGGLGGVELLVFAGEARIEVSGGVGRRLIPRLSFDPEGTTMKVERVGWVGTPLFAYECIVLSGTPGGRATKAAVRPLQGGLPDAWEALLRVGVTPKSTPPT
jgi:hypothetical protein